MAVGKEAGRQAGRHLVSPLVMSAGDAASWATGPQMPVEAEEGAMPTGSPAATSSIAVPLPLVVLPLQRAGQAHGSGGCEAAEARSRSQIEIREEKVFT